ncbi:MAG TPA: hypothetical protein VEC16_05610 [Alphaproteobacteria bacterium]|nr:hypothetical protein [Alphaproteobacteria bacterium]
MNILFFMYIVIISLTISLTWTIIGRNEYSYNRKFPKFFGVNSFPLAGWTIGLVVIMVLYYYLENLLQIKLFYYQFLFFLLLYWTLLFALEYVGYHILNIRNNGKMNYKGLPLIDVIHVVWWMKIVYLSLGPIMFIVCKLIL